MARWTASAKWAEGPALDGQSDMPLALRLSEGLGGTLGRMRFDKRARDGLFVFDTIDCLKIEEH